MATVDEVREVLTEVYDPELQIDIVNLGMVYDIQVNGGDVHVTMTLTAMGCPIFDLLKGQIQERVSELDGVDNVDVELTFDPPWSPEKMSEEAKLAMRYMF
ncbi:MAG: metal-sulfur cluster assembly factor [Kyrpidia tusciae]|nr:metal-sulfur cluster assembly factor [Kyrpidia tusciae]MBE3551480.1 metal-sulfur cluster assembly factor [Kyrpidia tusciae]